LSIPAVLDHIVINARFEMDRAADIFTRLGFTLTPRGHHTLGSINHLMMFAHDYLELVGIAESDAHKRTDISGAPPGLNGLVFKTTDVDETYAKLKSLRMAGDPPKSFSRPVTLSDGTKDEAAFRTVSAHAEAFTAGRLYFCEHLTPELVWRPEWQTHANGVTGFSGLYIVTGRPGKMAARLAELLGAPVEENKTGGSSISLKNGFRLSFETQDAYHARFGGYAQAGRGRDAFLGALSLRASDQGSLLRFLDAPQEHVCISPAKSGFHAVIGAFDTLLCFED